jgi:hypothetical protein
MAARRELDQQKAVTAEIQRQPDRHSAVEGLPAVAHSTAE